MSNNLAVHHNMEYNSEKDILTIPEYGRNIQLLVQHAKTIEDKAERQKFVEAIINLMQQMNPNNRNLENNDSKLWKHVFRIANFDLDVEMPNGEVVTREEADKKPAKLHYPVMNKRFRHYGNNVRVMIAKAISLEDEEMKGKYVNVILSYMKLAYITWNKEHYVSDDIIKRDFEILCEGQLTMNESPIENLKVNRQHSGKSSNKRKKNNNNNKNNNKSRNRNNNHRSGKKNYRKK